MLKAAKLLNNFKLNGPFSKTIVVCPNIQRRPFRLSQLCTLHIPCFHKICKFPLIFLHFTFFLLNLRFDFASPYFDHSRIMLQLTRILDASANKKQS